MDSALLPSRASRSAISLAAETSPNCSTLTPRCAAWTAATAASGRSTSFSTWSSVPASSKFTTTERPSADTVLARVAGSSGLSICSTPSIRSSRVTTSLTAAVTRGSSPAIGPLPCTSTRSLACSGKPAASTIMSPRFDSPLPRAESSRSFWPTLPPTTVARTTNRIHPRMAGLRCWALHLPMRAAGLRDCMWRLLERVRTLYDHHTRTLYDPERGVNRTADAETADSHRTASAAEQGARAGGRRRAGPARRARVAEHAQARRRARRRRDVPLPPRRQQGAVARRDGRHRLRGDRAAHDRRGLVGRDAQARALHPRGPAAASVGGRPDGGAHDPRTRQPPAPRRGARVSARGRLLDRDDRPRLLGPGRLHLRVRAPGAGHDARERGGLRGRGAAADARVRGRARGLPPPRRGRRRPHRQDGL